MKCHCRLKLKNLVNFIQELLALNWIISMDKSWLEPTQNLQFIGGLLTPDLVLVQVPTDRWMKIQMAVHRALVQDLSQGCQRLQFLRNHYDFLSFITPLCPYCEILR